MRGKRLSSFIMGTGILVLALTFSGNSFAQGPPWARVSAEEMPKAFMEHEDSNGDGKVTREEFKGPDEHWNIYDKNQDGFITIDEVAKLDK